jgi:FAD/FMN-containing dehydrogenase
LKLIYGSDSGKLLSEGTTAYDAFTGGYWSTQQGSLSPHCVFQPGNTVEVSSLVLISRLTQCPFAVKGGGHGSFAGSSSIEGGITVSMESFKQATVSKDKKYVSVGPGNRWIDVYKSIENSGVGVVGGRVSLPKY